MSKRKCHRVPWPQKGNKLFVDGGDYYEFSHIGWDNLSGQFAAYVEAYKTTAEILVNIALSKKNIVILDTYVYPICFLYRQYLELQMKSIFISFSEVSKNEKIKMLRDVCHSLLKLWKKIKPILKQECNAKELFDIEIVEDYISQYNALDSSSSRFRYPITIDLQQTIDSEKRINLRNLRDRMEEIYNFFKGVEGKLTDIRDYKMELERDLLKFTRSLN